MKQFILRDICSKLESAHGRADTFLCDRCVSPAVNPPRPHVSENRASRALRLHGTDRAPRRRFLCQFASCSRSQCARAFSRGSAELTEPGRVSALQTSSCKARQGAALPWSSPSRRHIPGRSVLLPRSAWTQCASVRDLVA